MNRQTDMTQRFNALMQQANTTPQRYNAEETPRLADFLKSDRVDENGRIKKVSFLDSNYFRAICELAYCYKNKISFYVNKENERIVLSLLGKNIIGISATKKNAYICNYFDNTQTNQYLFDANGNEKSENVEKLREILKALEEKKEDLKIFSLSPIIEEKIITTLEF